MFLIKGAQKSYLYRKYETWILPHTTDKYKHKYQVHSISDHKYKNKLIQDTTIHIYIHEALTYYRKLYSWFCDIEQLIGTHKLLKIKESIDKLYYMKIKNHWSKKKIKQTQ